MEQVQHIPIYSVVFTIVFINKLTLKCIRNQQKLLVVNVVVTLDSSASDVRSVLTIYFMAVCRTMSKGFCFTCVFVCVCACQYLCTLLCQFVICPCVGW